MTSDVVSKRIFIGGLGTDVSEQDINEKFSRFGKISNLSVKQRKDTAGVVEKSFAHLNIECKEADLKKCFSTFQNAKWKGSTLKLQYAKESFLNKLDEERIEEKRAAVDLAIQKAEEAAALKLKQAPVAKIFVGPAVPGTQVPGKPDWIVGKYGRVLPVMKLKKSPHIPKVLRHDPSKLCHTAKVFKDKEVPLDSSCDTLSWDIEMADSEIVKKIKGEFKKTPTKKRKQPLSVTESVGNKQFVLENITSSKHYLELKKTLPSEDQIEVVSVSHEHKAPSISKQKESNRFDSDSETEFNSLSESTKKNKSKPRNVTLDQKLQLLAGSAPEKTDNNANDTAPNLTLSKNKNKSEKKLKMTVKKSHESSSDDIEVDKSIDMGSNYNSEGSDSEDNSVPLKSISSRNKQSGGQNFCKVPKFGGLSMLLSTEHNNTDTEASSQSSKKQKDSSKLTETLVPSNSKKQKLSNPSKQKNIPKEETSGSQAESDSDSSASTDAPTKSKADKMPKPINHSNSSKSKEATSDSQSDSDSASSVDTDEILQKHKTSKLNLTNLQASSVPSDSKDQKMSKTSNLNNNRKSKNKTSDSQSDSDSASSADTDEILQKHKAHQTQAFDTTPSPESSGKSYLKMLSKQRCSVLDNKLLTLAGIDSEKTNNTDNASTKAGYDSDDSELDSNDFELVAKRLAQRVSDKKASKSKSRITKSTPETIPMSTHADAFEEVLQALQPSDTESKSKPVPSKKMMAEEKNKSLTVNEKRLQAVKEKMKIKQQQQDIMKKALDNVDSKKNNKRKVFNSDDDDDDDKITAETNKKTKITQQTDKEPTNKDLKLFENSDDDSDEESNYADMFKSRPHLEGKKGEKLMKLERKIGDSRFKLDAKFADSDSGGEAEEDVGAEPSELAAEKDASLKLLEKVMGKTTMDIFTRKLKKNTKTIIDMNTVRFDPTKMSPIIPVKTKAEVKELPISSSIDEENIDAVEKSDETKSNAEKSETSKSNVVVSSSLVDLFRKEENTDAGGFSLLSQFDSSSHNPTDAATDLSEKMTMFSNSSIDKNITDNASDEEMYSTDEDDDTDEDDITDDSEIEDEVKDSSLNISTAKVTKNKIDPLFKDSDSDNSLAGESDSENESKNHPEETDVQQKISKELLDAGRVDIRYTKEKWLQRWEEIRPILVKIYKKKHKDAVKSRRIQSEQKRRKEFSKSSKRNSWFRKKR